MGCGKGEQPMLGEEFVRPTLMIPASPSPFAFHAFPQNAPKAHSNPAVELDECRRRTVLEVAKPATDNRSNLRYDARQAVCIAAPGVRTDGVLEFS